MQANAEHDLEAGGGECLELGEGSGLVAGVHDAISRHVGVPPQLQLHYLDVGMGDGGCRAGAAEKCSEEHGAISSAYPALARNGNCGAGISNLASNSDALLPR